MSPIGDAGTGVFRKYWNVAQQELKVNEVNGETAE